MTVWERHPGALKKAVSLRQQAKQWDDIARDLNAEFDGGFTSEQIRKKVTREGLIAEELPQKEEPKPTTHEEFLKAIEKPKTADELRQKFGMSERVVRAAVEDLREAGYLIDEYDNTFKISHVVRPEENVFKDSWKGEKVISFGVIGDTHMGSKWQQLTHSNAFYDILEREGIPTVYHAGDITDGVRMRLGHEHEIFLQGSDEQEEYVIDKYPKRNGISTKFITGNHDHSSIKHSGHGIGKRIAAHVGGWIIRVHVDDEGTITRCQSEFIPFYRMIDHDY